MNCLCSLASATFSENPVLRRPARNIRVKSSAWNEACRSTVPLHNNLMRVLGRTPVAHAVHKAIPGARCSKLTGRVASCRYSGRRNLGMVPIQKRCHRSRIPAAPRLIRQALNRQMRPRNSGQVPRTLRRLSKADLAPVRRQADLLSGRTPPACRVRCIDGCRAGRLQIHGIP